MSNAVEEKTLTVKQSIMILVTVIVILSGLGYYVGHRFFWNQFDTSNLYERQIESLEEYSVKNPQSNNAKVLLFDRYFGVGDFDKAREVLKDLKKELSDNPDIIYRDALMLRQDGDSEKALEEIKEVVEQESFFVPARILYSELLASQKNYDEALAEIQAVLKIMPAAADIYLEEAKIYLAKGDKEKALESISKAIKMVPDYQEALDLKSQINGQGDSGDKNI